MTGTFLSAWLLFPLTLLACSAGCGLLVARVSGKTLSGVLVLPVGFAVVVAICAFATSYSATAAFAGPVVAAAAVVGLALELRGSMPLQRHASRSRQSSERARSIRGFASRLARNPWFWPALAALAAFVAVGGPAFLTGTPTWTGYTRIVDIAFEMDFANHLAHFGRHTPGVGSSYNVLIGKLTGEGYPGGGQATLGGMSRLVGVEVPWSYQAYLAFAAAMGAIAVYSLLGRFTSNKLLCALGGAVAIQPNLLYGYVLSGGIKELTAASLILLVVALLLERLPGDGPRRGTVPIAVALSAALASFSFGALPWLGIVFAGLLVGTLVARRGRRRHVLESWLLLAAVTIVLSVPTLISAVKLFGLASGAIGGVVELGLGNLAAPLPAWSAAGVWLTGDYRFPLVHVTATHAFDIVVIVLALTGFAFAVRRRRWALALLGVSVPIALYYWIAHTGPWIQFKAFAITGTFAIAIAFVGIAALHASGLRWVRWLGLAAAAVIAVAVLYGNAITYHDTSLAPAARYENLAAIGERYAGQGPALYPAFDEYSEYFLRQERGSDTVNPAHGEFPFVPGAPAPASGVNFSVPIDEIAQSFLQRFRLIVTPRNPIAERPPSNYDLIEQSRYFRVWRRERPASSVLDFTPLTSADPTTKRICRAFVAEARRAGSGADVAYAEPPEAATTGLNLGPHPSYWAQIGQYAVLAAGAGTATTSVELPRAGRYSIWMEGSVGRGLGISLDGRRLGSLGYEERYPGQFLWLGEATLSQGKHTLQVMRGNGTLHPGSGDGAPDGEGRTLGAIVFRHEDASNDRVYVAPASAASRVCRADTAYQWLEVVKPSGVPANAIHVTR